MKTYEAKLTAVSAAANVACERGTPSKGMISAAISYLCGKMSKAEFTDRCAENLVYARIILNADKAFSQFDTEALCSVHKYINEPNAAAGEIRSTELVIPGGSCADPKILRGSLKNVLTKLQATEGAPNVSKADFAAQLCCYVRELLILSPFSYGNGTAIRTFIDCFCRARGFTINYAAAGKKEIATAENEAFAGDNPQPLFKLYIKCLNYIQENIYVKPDTAAIAQSAKPQIAAPLYTRPVKIKKQEALNSERRPEIAPLLSKQTEQKQRERPQRRKPKTGRPPAPQKGTLKQLKEVQKTLGSLATRVNDLIDELESKDK